MLRDLDDTLWHQVAENFEHVGSTDIRFYDRYWFAVYAPDGSIGMNVGMALYNNMNVIDGGATLVADGRQYSALFSRELRPDYRTAIGPFSIEPTTPLREFDLVLTGPSEPTPRSFSFNLRWRALWEPREEEPKRIRSNGRFVQRTQRFDQLGTVDGSVEVAGRHFGVSSWFGGRDHSWGVRDGVAGIAWERGTVANQAPGISYWFIFSTENWSGNVSFYWQAGRARDLTGGIVERRDGQEIYHSVEEVADITYVLYPGTSRYKSSSLSLVLDNNKAVLIESEELTRSHDMKGIGYEGFADRRGHGVWRGPYHEEWQVWDVTHPEDVIVEDGTLVRPWHRDNGATITIEGEAGVGHMHLMLLPESREKDRF
jgi:hypothetical protein